MPVGAADHSGCSRGATSFARGPGPSAKSSISSSRMGAMMRASDMPPSTSSSRNANFQSLGSNPACSMWGMRLQHGVDFRRIEGKGLVVQFLECLAALTIFLGHPAFRHFHFSAPRTTRMTIGSERVMLSFFRVARRSAVSALVDLHQCAIVFACIYCMLRLRSGRPILADNRRARSDHARG